MDIVGQENMKTRLPSCEGFGPGVKECLAPINVTIIARRVWPPHTDIVGDVTG